MTNREFLSTLKKGDFVVAEHKHFLGKLLACFNEFDESERTKKSDYYVVNSIFFIGYLGRFRVGIPFGVTDSMVNLRKASIGEMFRIAEELKRNGYVYNRKTKQLYKKL